MSKKAESTIRAILKFTEPLLGTLPGDPKVAQEYIISRRDQSKAPEGATGTAEEEAQALEESDEEVLEKKSTVFARQDNSPILWDYQIKGFLKEACHVRIGTETMTKEELKKIKLSLYSYKRTIDGLIFVFPRKIPIQNFGDLPLQYLERPLRGETMKGERVALARSEMIPAGASIDIEIKLLNTKLADFVKQWLEYGALRGLGGWRNASYGRFETRYKQ
jgi:hypothetical protein